MPRAGRRISRRSLLRGAGIGAAAGLVSGGGVAVGAEYDNEAVRRRAADTNRHLVSGERLGSCRVVWSVDTTEPAIAVTFDDGPDPDLTPLALAALAGSGAPATFFVVGERARRHPDLVRAILEAGHELGSHSMSHRDLSGASPTATAAEVADAASTLAELAGTPVRWFRPPWGRLTGAALRAAAEVGQDVLLWSTTAGGLGPAVADIEAGLPPRLTPGRVLMLHDGVARGRRHPLARGQSTSDLMARRRLELTALPQVLATAAAAGTSFLTASDLSALGSPSA